MTEKILRKQMPIPPPSPDWRSIIWYLPLMFVVLWLWQDVGKQLTVHTIPYSQFKEYLAHGEVAECAIEEDEISGRIQPHSQTTPTQETTKKAAPLAAPAIGTELSGSGIGESNKEADQKESKKPGEQTDTVASHEAEPQPTAVAAAPPAEAAPPKTTKKEQQPPTPFLFRTVRVEDPKLVDELVARHVSFAGERPGFMSSFLLSWILPLGLVALLWAGLSRGLGAARESAMSFGRSKAKLVADRDTGVTFTDVAGCEEAKVELQEVVDFLRNPSKYESLGAKIPKGVLLVGPPGTGKTLMARAVAGEAKVPFFAISGSEFVEMFVGVGAARVRDLFLQAKQHAPCIIFVDELDAIGRQRGAHLGFVNDEREQTLNQMLVEMDGFEANVGVILLAATNRPEVLDRALLRPGRFDRQIVVDAPDFEGRLAILGVHSQQKPLAPEVDLRIVARETPGFAGADLANTINEAALLAARRGAQSITQKDLEDAVEKVVAGPERRSRRLDPDEKRRVAYHETGHAIVAAYSNHADPVHKITIVPRGRAALGYTMLLPEQNRFLMSRSQLLDQIKGLLGGRASEELVFDDVTTGAENDLDHATNLARQMVCMYGMSETLGLVHYGHRQDLLTLPGVDPSSQRDWSEETAKKVDQEVKKLLDEAHEEAKGILKEHRTELDRVAQELLKRETISGDEFRQLLAKMPVTAGTPEGTASGPTGER